MLKATGYDIRLVIYEDAAIMVCQAWSVKERRDVLLKIVKEGPKAIIENAKVMNEYEVAGSLDFPGILKPLSLFREGNRLIMASEWAHGVTLKHFVMSGAVSLPVFLKIAIGITAILERLHQKNIIHMNIRPETVVVVPATMQVYLTGLGHAFAMNEDRRQTGNMPLMEGSPPYMAPERSRQLDGWIGAGADLYSLGVTLYEALAGRLPFPAKNVLEWAHAHVARAPLPMDDVSPDVPVILQQVILKLLEKSVMRRYRSAAGLRADLEACLKQYEEQGRIDGFELGRQDSCGPAGAPSEKHPDAKLPDGKRMEAKGSYAQVLDLEAVLRASQAFSEEKDSLKLLSRLMTIMMEASGADKGVWVKSAGGELFTALKLDLKQDASLWTGFLPLDACGEVSPAIVREAAISREPVIRSDAGGGRFDEADPYMLRHGPKSVLGLPVLMQGELQGVLYLENNYTAGVFVGDGLSLLQMLALQMGQVHALTQYFEPSSREESGREPLPGSAPALTNRELDVLQGVAAGLSNKEIADRLVMSAGTVKVHVRNVFDKLGVNNRVKAVAMAAKLNLLQTKGIPQMGYVQDEK
ncbi:Serine/threonine protein kinase [Paenibacillus sp. UNCCL117]|uniref:protein kinase domain-containing protein n=1 Tax=unclassified Paenibacillus TaxID=185978 RepID=UPI000885ECE0|nr:MULTISPECIES: LuxR C-terminal-related transcriptional regulator [unclassified Paenibacillus]SDC13259.1 Serine/threonine protein kinase [Paenibacillus sp. cl123]SFW17024.1 Serine/threonine protein kinase [Paenibacillus sp. UNCCL117]